MLAFNPSSPPWRAQGVSTTVSVQGAQATVRHHQAEGEEVMRPRLTDVCAECVHMYGSHCSPKWKHGEQCQECSCPRFKQVFDIAAPKVRKT